MKKLNNLKEVLKQTKIQKQVNIQIMLYWISIKKD